MIEAINVFKTPVDANYFFGYYDKSQLNNSNNKLLALKVEFMDRIPNKYDVATIGYFDLEHDNNFVVIGETKAFNWQQGCMLQWDGPGFNDQVIFNDVNGADVFSVIININTLNKVINRNPIYTMHPCGDIALTIDFERHHWCRRGYSYDGDFAVDKNKKIVEGDYIKLVDLKKDTSKKIVIIEKVMKINPLSNMNGATHYLEHVMFSPSGDSFCFLHRWKIIDGGIYSRLYTMSIDGSNLSLINDSGRMGHFGWKNDRELLAYAGLVNRINTLRKNKNILKYFIKPLLPLYHRLVNDNSKLSKAITGDSYILFNIDSGTVCRVADSISSEDGHPSFSKNNNKNTFITDTYPDPDEGSIAKLILFDLDKNEFQVIDELKSIGKYDNSPIRCDLHPRWSLDGSYVSIDTMNDGVRGCYLYRMVYE